MNLQPVSEPPNFRAICKLCGKEIAQGEKLADLDAKANTYYHAACMQPRTELKQAYATNSHGMIISPGKFEGEMLYVPYFWNIGLDGFADEDDGEVFTFYPSPNDYIMFPELEESETIYLFETGQGFVEEVDGPEEDDIDWPDYDKEEPE